MLKRRSLPGITRQQRSDDPPASEMKNRNKHILPRFLKHEIILMAFTFQDQFSLLPKIQQLVVHTRQAFACMQQEYSGVPATVIK